MLLFEIAVIHFFSRQKVFSLSCNSLSTAIARGVKYVAGTAKPGPGDTCCTIQIARWFMNSAVRWCVSQRGVYFTLILLLCTTSVGSQADNLTGTSFENLSREARQLLLEFRAQLEITSQEYSNLRIRATVKTFRGDDAKSPARDGLAAATESLRSVEVTRLGTSCYRADEIQIDSGERRQNSAIFLISDSQQWHLGRDTDSGKYFIREHGRVQTPRRLGQFQDWWVDAATSYLGRSIGSQLLQNGNQFRIISVQEFTNGEGERLVLNQANSIACAVEISEKA